MRAITAGLPGGRGTSRRRNRRTSAVPHLDRDPDTGRGPDRLSSHSGGSSHADSPVNGPNKVASRSRLDESNGGACAYECTIRQRDYRTDAETSAYSNGGPDSRTNRSSRPHTHAHRDFGANTGGRALPGVIQFPDYLRAIRAGVPSR